MTDWEYPKITLSETELLTPIKCTADAVKLLKSKIIKRNEYFIGLSLDGDRYPISARIMSIGDRNQATISVPDVMRSIISDGANGAVFIHNHPYGNTDPSSGDIDCLKSLESAADILKIAIVDFIIVHDNDFCAVKTKFNQESIIPTYKIYLKFIGDSLEKFGNIMIPMSMICLSLIIFQLYIQTTPSPIITVSTLIFLYPLSWGIKTIGGFLKLI